MWRRVVRVEFLETLRQRVVVRWTTRRQSRSTVSRQFQNGGRSRPRRQDRRAVLCSHEQCRVLPKPDWPRHDRAHALKAVEPTETRSTEGAVRAEAATGPFRQTGALLRGDGGVHPAVFHHAVRRPKTEIIHVIGNVEPAMNDARRNDQHVTDLQLDFA